MAAAYENSSEVVMRMSKGCHLVLEQYTKQQKCWPKWGRHILAQFDDNSILVYQAYKPSIAEYAVENQR